MLFTRSALLVASAASLASALSHEPTLFEPTHDLAKRACPKVNLSTSQKKEAAALSSLSKALASKSKTIASKSKSVASRASAVSKSVSKAEKAASSASKVEKSISSAAKSLASRASAISSKAASVNSKSASINSKSSSVVSKASSVSSAAAAAASTAAANANSTCYKVASLEVAMTSSATDLASCRTSCGANYGVVGLVEPDSPPAECYCIDTESIDDLTAVAASLCNGVWGSKDGDYVTLFSS